MWGEEGTFPNSFQFLCSPWAGQNTRREKAKESMCCALGNRGMDVGGGRKKPGIGRDEKVREVTLWSCKSGAIHATELTWTSGP